MERCVCMLLYNHDSKACNICILVWNLLWYVPRQATSRENCSGWSTDECTAKGLAVAHNLIAFLLFRHNGVGKDDLRLLVAIPALLQYPIADSPGYGSSRLRALIQSDWLSYTGMHLKNIELGCICLTCNILTVSTLVRSFILLWMPWQLEVLISAVQIVQFYWANHC